MATRTCKRTASNVTPIRADVDVIDSSACQCLAHVWARGEEVEKPTYLEPDVRIEHAILALQELIARYLVAYRLGDFAAAKKKLDAASRVGKLFVLWGPMGRIIAACNPA